MLIQNKGKYTYNIGARLIPGGNQLNETEIIAFKEASKLSINAQLISEGTIVIPESGNKDFSESIRDLATWQAAVELVKDTFDLSLLRQFKEDEEIATSPRSSVLKAINEQIESIENPPEENRVEIS
ncbi:hypothetical protein [Listeria seeligeri]|uniref:hypothetical protein n=1 Tax=Listeria seeligeri TaxID=1640 RepID=UPI001624D19B|nr:hypothetical protein [Listeria seeligeri]MBC1722255.1 hypothetical protein [Listeria seeligeri]MBF2435782.1 hypothetical protein [Listeria seeligeri]MBM5675603.1 hypothetical protein [Listeria seeligeri]